MHNIALFALLLGGLAGCATEPLQYGNFIEKTSETNDKKIADDVVKQLVKLYPPAITRFNLQHDTRDYFGTYLVESLRGKGYAIHEFKTESDASGKTNTASIPGALNTGSALSYILDQANESDLYRVTLVINQQSLDRVYRIQDGTIYPAGYWVRKSEEHER